MEEKNSLLLKYFYITLVVASYWVVSISMVFVNKTLLSGSSIHLEAPFFITWFQCIVCIIFIHFLQRMTVVFPRHIKFSTESYKFTAEITRKIFPVSFIFVSMITANNLCLKYVGVAFYYIGRSLTTVFNVIFTYIILGEKSSLATITCCAIIVLGFYLGIDQENITGSLSIAGVIFGVLGSLSVSLYSIGTKKILPFVNQDIWCLSYYNNVFSALLLVPLMMFNQEFQVLYNYDRIWDLYFWNAMIIAGVCGIAIGYVTALQIQVTSALTHNISGTAKSCAQTVLATYWYDEHKSMLWWFSNFLVLGGSASYARVKQLSMKQKAQSIA